MMKARRMITMMRWSGLEAGYFSSVTTFGSLIPGSNPDRSILFSYTSDLLGFGFVSLGATLESAMLDRTTAKIVSFPI